MTKRGFALLAVLWLIVALAAVGGVSVAGARLGAATTRNRVLLARADWAREACVEILRARSIQHPDLRALDTVNLGRGTWCTARVEDPGARLNVNQADRQQLVRVLCVLRDPSSAAVLADSIITHRPYADVAELAAAGIESVDLARLEGLFTTRGSGQINLNTAAPEVLMTVPGLTSEALSAILGRRAMGQRLASADELSSAISPSARDVLYADYQDFLHAATFAPSQLVVTVTGGAQGTRLVAHEILTAVPLPERLAIVRREVE